MIKKALPYLLSLAIIFGSFAAFPISAADSGLKPAEISAAYTSDGWYRTYPGNSSDTATRYIEIAEDGADDIGSLHFVNSGNQGDMRVNIEKYIPAGNYTLSFKIKGNRKYPNESFYFSDFASRGDINKRVQLIPNSYGYSGWTEITRSFTSYGGNNYIFFFSQYNGDSSIYIDNFKVLDSDGNDMLEGAGNFCVSDSGSGETVKMLQPYDDVNEEYWYRTYPGGADTASRYIEIAKDGADDIGSLHFVNSGTNQGDMRINIAKTIPAGSYTLSLKLKGTRSSSDMAFYFCDYALRGSTDKRIELMSGVKSYSDWTEVTFPFTSDGRSNYIIFFSQHNGDSSIYIDNLKILDSESNDVLDGLGNFDRLAEDSGGEDPVPEDVLTLYDSKTAGGWYNYSETAFTNLRKAEIVGDGCFDNGSLHIKNTAAAGDIRVCVNKTVPAGEYTLKVNVKGKKGVITEAFYFSSLTDAANSFELFPKNSFSDWTELCGSFKTNGGNDFIIFFSQYNGASDIYLDNLRVIDENGVDMLGGLGSFSSEPQIGEQTSVRMTPQLESGDESGFKLSIDERSLIGPVTAADGAVILNGEIKNGIAFKAAADGILSIDYAAAEGDVLSIDGALSDNYYKKHVGPVSFRYSGGKWRNLLTANGADFYFFETLIENCGFADGTDGWEQNPKSGVGSDTVFQYQEGYDGASLGVKHNAASGELTYKVRTSDYIPVSAGETYHLRLMVKATGSMRLGASLRGNGNYTVPAESGLNTVVTGGTDGWQQLNYTFTLPADDKGLTAVKVQLDNQFYSSDAEILYDNIAFYREYQPGDVTADGEVDIRDFVRFKKAAAGTAEYASPNAADLNGNGFVNIIDFTTLRRRLLGLSDYGSEPYVAVVAPYDTVYPYNSIAKGYLTAENASAEDYAFKMTDSAQDVRIVLECPVENASFKVEYATKADYSDAVAVNTSSKSVAVNNLYRNTVYYVRVTAYANGFVRTDESTFKTADIGPRVMTVGGITNVRDLGGYATSFGRTTVQGIAFRGAQPDLKGKSLLTSQGARVLGEDIAVKLDLDLRTASENGNMTASVIKSADYFNCRIGSYSAAFSENQKEFFYNVFASYADVNNYPIYVHCVYGADRTGTVCYILNALLGVDEKTLIQDYEYTTFSYAGLRSSQSDDMKAFLSAFNSLSGKTAAEKAESYLHSIGITDEQIATIRGIFFGDIPVG